MMHVNEKPYLSPTGHSYGECANYIQWYVQWGKTLKSFVAHIKCLKVWCLKLASV